MLPFTLVEIPVGSPLSFTLAKPSAPLPKEGTGASIENNDKNLPFVGAVANIKSAPSIK